MFASTYLRRLMMNITPTIVVKGLYSIRSRLQGQARKPDPSDYSTLDNPLEVPVQVEAYLLCRDKYLKPGDTVLDIGFGLGFGLQIMAGKAENLFGLDVDPSAVHRATRVFQGHPRVRNVALYDGLRLPLPDRSVDVVTCVDVIEHVEDYGGLLLEMRRVAQRVVFISTPNRRPEYTRPDGRPRNRWHLREWTWEELRVILTQLGFECEWNFINGPFSGPFTLTNRSMENTLSLVPVILVALHPYSFCSTDRMREL